jgi:branched-chain amino acid transport system substrate-binding protein
MLAESRRLSLGLLARSVVAGLFLFAAAPTQAAEPIKIGFGMSLTGPLSANGKMSLVAMQI